MERLPDRQPDRERDRGCAYPGNPGRPGAAVMRARIEARARELSEGQYDRLGVRDRTLLTQAAVLLVTRPRNGEDAVRRANAVSRLLGRVRGLRHADPAPPSPSFDEAL
jgi:hypothetical protein